MCWITQALADLTYTKGQYFFYKAELLINTLSTELNIHTFSHAGFPQKYFIKDI